MGRGAILGGRGATSSATNEKPCIPDSRGRNFWRNPCVMVVVSPTEGAMHGATLTRRLQSRRPKAHTLAQPMRCGFRIGGRGCNRLPNQ
eukprot:9472360-Pyramimonas_sp.AAC.2